MTLRVCLGLALAATLCSACLLSHPASACCPAPPSGKPVVNADQTVIILWDRATQTEHFIRRASFKSEADDFGFLVPTPNQPDLNESGNEAFAFLGKLTEPEIVKTPRPSGGMGCGCSMPMGSSPAAMPDVIVLDDKMVAGFHAVVLETHSTVALVGWLKEHGYAFSPEVEAWAKPYVEGGWKITALQVAKRDAATEKKTVTAAALRMSFKTDRPLFPYREPESRIAAQTLGASDRLLRIYFIGEARYQGYLTRDTPWTGKVAWSNKLGDPDRKKTLDLLHLPPETGPVQWWLTEFEDHWPYRVAPADLYFALGADQNIMKRAPIIEYVSAKGHGDVTPFVLAFVAIMPCLMRRAGRKRN